MFYNVNLISGILIQSEANKKLNLRNIASFKACLIHIQCKLFTSTGIIKGFNLQCQSKFITRWMTTSFIIVGPYLFPYNVFKIVRMANHFRRLLVQTWLKRCPVFIICLIQGKCFFTRTTTPGESRLAHCNPRLTKPIKVARSSTTLSFSTLSVFHSGPPLSPMQVSCDIGYLGLNVELWRAHLVTVKVVLLEFYESSKFKGLACFVDVVETSDRSLRSVTNAKFSQFVD